MTAKIGGGDRRDFDETRRLLYMALAARYTKKYNLVGTLVNALVHHHDLDVSWQDATAHLVAVVDRPPEQAIGADETWVEEQIHRISGELQD